MTNESCPSSAALVVKKLMQDLNPTDYAAFGLQANQKDNLLMRIPNSSRGKDARRVESILLQAQ
jgi:hypothetical protein